MADTEKIDETTAGETETTAAPKAAKAPGAKGAKAKAAAAATKAEKAGAAAKAAGAETKAKAKAKAATDNKASSKKAPAKKATKAKSEGKPKAAATEELEAKAGRAPKKIAPKKPAADVQALVDELSVASRLKRQDAARQLRDLAEDRVAELKSVAPELLDALDRPEAQTRWHIMDTLAVVGADDPELVADGFEGAENALFEEGGGAAAVRLSAFRFLVLIGKSSPARSNQVWPLLDEAAQVYHGQPEYREMLLAMLQFAQGDISAETKRAVADRVRFDATGKTGGFLRTYSAQILEAVEGKS